MNNNYLINGLLVTITCGVVILGYMLFSTGETEIKRTIGIFISLIGLVGFFTNLFKGISEGVAANMYRLHKQREKERKKRNTVETVKEDLK